MNLHEFKPTFPPSNHISHSQTDPATPLDFRVDDESGNAPWPLCGLNNKSIFIYNIILKFEPIWIGTGLAIVENRINSQ